jgi:hypothetical protein
MNTGSTKKALITGLAILVLMLAGTAPALAASDASLNGVYRFQINGVSTQNGYFSGSTFVQCPNPIPKGVYCNPEPFVKYTSGTLTFNGAGKITAGTYSTYNPNKGSQSGTVTGTYTVQPDGTGAINVLPSKSGGAIGFTISLAHLNSAGAAQTILLVQPANVGSNGYSAETGFAFHQ